MLVSHNYRHWLMRLLGARSPIIDIEHLQIFSPASLAVALGAPASRGANPAVCEWVPAALLGASRCRFRRPEAAAARVAAPARTRSAAHAARERREHDCVGARGPSLSNGIRDIGALRDADEARVEEGSIAA